MVAPSWIAPACRQIPAGKIEGPPASVVKPNLAPVMRCWGGGVKQNAADQPGRNASGAAQSDQQGGPDLTVKPSGFEDAVGRRGGGTELIIMDRTEAEVIEEIGPEGIDLLPLIVVRVGEFCGKGTNPVGNLNKPLCRGEVEIEVVTFGLLMACCRKGETQLLRDRKVVGRARIAPHL